MASFLAGVLEHWGSLLTAAGMGIAFIWAIKIDTKVLALRLDKVDEQLKKIDGVLVVLAEQRGRMDVLDERNLAQGKRLDELTKAFHERVAQFVDMVEEVYRNQKH